MNISRYYSNTKKTYAYGLHISLILSKLHSGLFKGINDIVMSHYKTLRDENKSGVLQRLKAADIVWHVFWSV